jgi:hypothetical protein
MGAMACAVRSLVFMCDAGSGEAHVASVVDAGTLPCDSGESNE